MSIGEQPPLDALGEIPENLIVKNYVPQTDLLQYTKFFITHGGMNSTNEALYNGVPLIVIPLSEAANYVLNTPSIHKAVASIKECFQQSGGYHKAVDEIFKFKSQYDI